MANDDENKLLNCGNSEEIKEETPKTYSNFECTYCTTSFSGPPQANEKLHLYKEHLVGFHKISKDVNKMIHLVAIEHQSNLNKVVNVLTSKDNQTIESKPQKYNDNQTQTCAKDLYRHFMHQEWDSAIDWKTIPNLSNSRPKHILSRKKENRPHQEETKNERLPVIEKALSLNVEAFNRIGMNIQQKNIDDRKVYSSTLQRKKIDAGNASNEESPNKKRELNINDWTRPVKSKLFPFSKSSAHTSNNTVNLKRDMRDDNLQGKYTFDLVNEPSAKRQKIVVRFTQDQENDMPTSNILPVQHVPDAKHSDQSNDLRLSLKENISSNSSPSDVPDSKKTIYYFEDNISKN